MGKMSAEFKTFFIFEFNYIISCVDWIRAKTACVMGGNERPIPYLYFVKGVGELGGKPYKP